LHLTKSYSEAQQGAEIADPDVDVLLAEVDDSLAGYAQLRVGEAPACVAHLAPFELWRFYVDTPWHGRGVAQALMEAVADAARARGASALWLSVWEHNPRAQAFYAKVRLRPGRDQAVRRGHRRAERLGDAASVRGRGDARHQHHHPAFVLALAATVGCATSRPRLQLPPYTLMSATTLDSYARSCEALDSARMTVDGAPAADADVVTSTFVVRRGGMGEAEIRLRVRLHREPPTTPAPASSS
jgi:GNAT superfamily N-acetyltransferase